MGSFKITSGESSAGIFSTNSPGFFFGLFFENFFKALVLEFQKFLKEFRQKFLEAEGQHKFSQFFFSGICRCSLPSENPTEIPSEIHSVKLSECFPEIFFKNSRDSERNFYEKSSWVSSKFAI